MVAEALGAHREPAQRLRVPASVMERESESPEFWRERVIQRERARYDEGERVAAREGD